MENSQVEMDMPVALVWVIHKRKLHLHTIQPKLVRMEKAVLKCKKQCRLGPEVQHLDSNLHT